MIISSTKKSHPRVSTFGHNLFLLACFLYPVSCLILWRLKGGTQMILFKPPSPKPIPRNCNSSSTISALDMGISAKEWERLQTALYWPCPDQEITELSVGTSLVHSTFSIVGLSQSYRVGEKIFVTITSRDHNKNLKRYGGDFFKVKLFNLELKASVYGEVVDHRNGTYSATLLLPWEGQAQVSVRLEHSSEVVAILKKYRESSFTRSIYTGHFEGPGSNKTRIGEVVQCNLKWGANGSWIKGDCCCEYKDAKTGTVWQCERPKKLSCDKLVYHSKGGLKNPLNLIENQFFTNTLTNIEINGDTQIFNVLPNTANIGTMEKCRPGLATPVPAGFYLNDVWNSFMCKTQKFNSSQIGHCLKNKIVYLMGDSTTRQWFEYFQTNVPGIKRMNLHTPRAGGPMMAVELTNNIIVHWRAHGVPLRFSKMSITDLHFISNDIDEIAGGPYAVVVFTFFAHLVFHPLTFYVHEVTKIRQSVISLLSRAPETIVIIKSGNTAGFKDVFQSDWYVMQLNTVMQEMFRDIDGVIYFDVWQMTSCHYLKEDIHPGPVIIANEIDMLLSYVCPS